MREFLFKVQGQEFSAVKNKWWNIYKKGKFITKVKNLKDLKKEKLVPPTPLKKCVYVSVKASYKSRKKNAYSFNMSFQVNLNKINEDGVINVIRKSTFETDYFFTIEGIEKNKEKTTYQKTLGLKKFEIGFSDNGKEGNTGDRRFNELYSYLKKRLDNYAC
jgi:hypothetical protein